MTTYVYILNNIAALTVIAAFFPYIRSIIRGQTKPSRATWIIWTVLANLIATSMFALGTLNVQIAIIAIGDLAVLALALRYGVPGWSRLDIGCLVGGFLGIAGWIVTGNPKVGIVIAVCVIVIGTIPTWVKTWHYPEQENATSYGLMTVSSLATIAVVPAWTIADALQPIAYLGIAGSMLFLILVPVKRIMAST